MPRRGSSQPHLLWRGEFLGITLVGSLQTFTRPCPFPALRGLQLLHPHLLIILKMTLGENYVGYAGYDG